MEECIQYIDILGEELEMETTCIVSDYRNPCMLAPQLNLYTLSNMPLMGGTGCESSASPWKPRSRSSHLSSAFHAPLSENISHYDANSKKLEGLSCSTWDVQLPTNWFLQKFNI